MPFRSQSTHRSTLDQCAALVVEVGPVISRTLKSSMRRHAPSVLTVPQFRALLFTGRHPNASLGELAEFLGITQPTASATVDRLGKQGLIRTRTPAEDRRRMCLTLTDKGRSVVKAARAAAHQQVKARLKGLSKAEQQTVLDALGLLRSVFEP
jgi:DNA-binding MarR family transcriptional regulator